MATILTEDSVRVAPIAFVEGQALVEPSEIEAAIGWQLKPEGLCRGDVCVPIKPSVAEGLVALDTLARTLGRPLIADAAEDLVVLGVAAETRRRALDQLELPDVTLPDLTGKPHNLRDWRGRKKLLIAFSSW